MKNQHSNPKKIKTLKVIREVEKEITYVKFVKESVDVSFEDLTTEDIDTLSHKESIAVAKAYKDLYLQAKGIVSDFIENSNTPVTEPTLNTTDTIDVVEVIEDEVDAIVPVNPVKTAMKHPRSNGGVRVGSGESNDEMIGNKHEKASSIYHYVFWSRNQQSWRTIHNNIKHDTEIEAALASDGWLDEVGDKVRPLNRKEFPEIMEAYNKKEEGK